MSEYQVDQRRPAPSEYGAVSYPEPSRATAAFVLGLLGMLVFPLMAPFAWALGSQEIAAIDAGRRPPDNRSMARIGQILGIVMSVVLILFVLIVAVVLVVSFL